MSGLPAGYTLDAAASTPAAAVPEPGSALMLALGGLAVVAGMARRRRRIA